MATNYKILHKLPNGEFLSVASRDERNQADLLVQSLKLHCPGEYEILEIAAKAETHSGIDVDAPIKLSGHRK
jgi:hypothetical protein